MQKYNLIHAVFLFWKKDFFPDVILFWKKRPFRYMSFLAAYLAFLSLPFYITQWNNFVGYAKPMMSHLPELRISKGKILADEKVMINDSLSGEPVIVIDTSTNLIIPDKKQAAIFIDKSKIVFRNKHALKVVFNAQDFLVDDILIKPKDILRDGWGIYFVIYLFIFFSEFLFYLFYSLILTVILRFFLPPKSFMTHFCLFSISLFPVMLTNSLSCYGLSQFLFIIGFILFFITSRSLMRNLPLA